MPFPPIAGSPCAFAAAPTPSSEPGHVLALAMGAGQVAFTGEWSRRFLVVDLLHRGAHCGKLWLRLWAAGEAEARLNVLLGLLPDVPARLSLDLSFRDGQSVFLRRHPGLLKGVCFGRRLDPAETVRATLELEDTGGAQVVHLGLPHLADHDQGAVAPPGPLVDALGQWAHRTWPGKTASPEALVADLRAAASAPRPPAPASWSRFGGSRAHRFAATGFFRTHHDGRRWWLVDPEGCGFWSAGIDCVRPTQDSAIPPGTAPLFSWLPPGLPERHGAPTADFMVANLERAFGDAWKARWSALTGDRLRAWRCNTIGNWSDPAIGREQAIPYVLPMPAYPTTAVTLFRDLPDVCDPAFADDAARWAAHLAPLASDPLLVGYFLNNEPHWGFGSFNLASEMLEANPGSHARRRLAQWLSERHGGDVRRLSAAWGIPLASFDDLVQQTFRRLADRSPAAGAELWEFSRELVRAYVAIPSAACRRVAPNHLNLGLRYAWIASELFYEAGDCVDVFTINCYLMRPDSAQAAEIQRRCKRPSLIGEWHMGAMDRGLPATGLRGVADQAERGAAYRRYLELAAADPNLVGAHWFQYGDQALLGRFDGENYQIGCVDVCHRPYPEFTAAMTASHERLYGLVDGSLEPVAREAREVPRVAF